MSFPIKLTLLFLLFLGNAYASVDCAKAKMNMNTTCGLLERQCESIKSCLTRKDTCLKSGKPNNPSECQELNTCVKAIKDELPASERCEYSWATTETSSFCRAKTHFLFSKESCPGRFGGLLNTVAYGFDASLDTEFKCTGTHGVYKQYVKSCERLIEEFSSSCLISDQDRAHAESQKPKKCEFYDNFADYKPGHFAINIPESIKVDQSSRSKVKEFEESKEDSKKGTAGQTR